MQYYPDCEMIKGFCGGRSYFYVVIFPVVGGQNSQKNVQYGCMQTLWLY